MRQYIHKGFENFSKGTMGNGGQNLYVSKKGVLQRIFNFDTTGNGCFDIMITNSHDYNEKPRLAVISDPASDKPIRKEILTDGSHAAAVADLNGDGFDDVIIASKNNGHLSDLAAFVYYGGPDGLTENHKIELSAPGCISVACGDFNGDGLMDIAFVIAGGYLRIYTQSPEGFYRDAFVDLPIDLTHIVAADLDNDGCADLYCRENDGEWMILWGSPEGFLLGNRTTVGPPTDDSIFDIRPFGGGNLRYEEQARPKVLTINGQQRLLYCGKSFVSFYKIEAGRRVNMDFFLPIPGVISAATGDIGGKGTSDLALLCRPAGGKEELWVLYEQDGIYNVADPVIRSTENPRDVLITDFSGNGYGDIAICQGRDWTKYTTESLLFCVDDQGIAEEPKRFVTHNAVGVLTARTTGKDQKLIFVNHQQSSTYGHVSAYVYTGDKDGWRADRRVELPGHSPGSMLPVDFNDDGHADILLVNNGEDQPHLNPPSYIYWGGTDGLHSDDRTAVPTYLTWGAQAADINKDGYLDIIYTSTNQQKALNRNIVTVLYGSEEGYSIKNSQTLELAPQEEPLGMLWGCLADLNGDGWLDFVVPLSYKSYSLILWGGPDGYSLQRSQKLPVEGALTIRTADLNNNGYLDLVFGTRPSTFRNKGHEGSVMIYWGGPKGYSMSRCCELPAYETDNITIGDLNNDGFLDIFVSSYLNAKERDINSYIYWNDKGSFSVTNRQRIFSHSSAASLACDLNEDGYVDLIVSGHRAYGDHHTEVAIWWNGPDGFREDHRSFLPCLGPHDMVGVDLGNVYDRSPEEYYISAPVELCDGENVAKIWWEATVPVKTWVHAMLRAADTVEELKKLPFVGSDGTAKTYYENGTTVSGLDGKFVQYKLAIGAINNIGTPRITEVCLETE